MKKILTLFLFFQFLSIGHAGEMEGFAGAALTKYDGVDGYDTYGASARLKYNMYNAGKGLFLYSNFKGVNILNFDALLGYGLRSSGSWFGEAGAGVFYSYLFGPGIGGILSTGIQVDSNWFLSLPLVIRIGGLGYIQISPMIGWRF
jgi:hypothetical protein